MATQKLGLGEIVSRIRAAKKTDEKVHLLQKYRDKDLEDVFVYTYHPNAVWLLPETAPPFTKNEKRLDLQNQMRYRMKHMPNYLQTPQGIKMKQLRRESNYVQLLESVDPDDADLLLEMKNGKIKGITKAVVQKAYPDLAKGW